MASSEDNPSKISSPKEYRRQHIPTKQIAVLPPPRRPLLSFNAALARRRSAERFGRVGVIELADWLFFCAGTQKIYNDDRNRELRFVASFGALHPAHIVLGFPDGAWMTYLPKRHCLGTLDINPSAADLLRSKAQKHHNCAEATLVVLISDYSLVQNYYEHAGGLILRDAGVLLGHAQLVAAALGLGFRILGCTGAPESEELVKGLTFSAVATGLAWIGALP